MKREVNVVECDTQIQKVYKANSPEDIQVDVMGRGGTSFTPIMEYMKENCSKDTVLIYATDGYGESKLECENISQSTIWLLTTKKDQLSCMNDVRPQDKVLSLSNE